MLRVVVAACASFGASARADSLSNGDTPSVLVITATTKPGSAEADVTEAVRDALAELHEVKLLPPSPLDLESVQLAIDCTDESAHCLSEIATRMEAQIVIIPALKSRADALELRLTCFKQSAPEGSVTAMRKQAGARLDATLLSTVPSMVREVLQLTNAQEDRASEVEPETEQPEGQTSEQPAAHEDSQTQSATTIGGLPLGPVLLGGGGLTLIAAGIVVGAIASGTEDDYASREIDTVDQARDADAVRETGEQQALIANILLGTGAAALIGAGVWYLLDRPKENQPASASLSPVLGPRSAGLVFTGHWQSQL